ncbi:hypothetical protein KI387_007215 [Taxus chinensis]|uniref:RING-type E3 ubiquitin transferase n=1 Tax=Taxus chinensis TaxID=29808 RepID=A0AA38LMU5_TAXCH|nr:hypothetical protein KI387_007215 [Taxus chinensis]
MSSERRRFSVFRHSKNREWPAEFMCPISGSPMADPVIVCSGQSYERRCIEAWMKLGQRYCHVTGTDLLNSTVIANVALGTAISHWCQGAGLPKPGSPDPETAKNFALKLINRDRDLSSGNGYSSVSYKSRLFEGNSEFRAQSNSNSHMPTSGMDFHFLQKSMKNVSLENLATPTSGLNSDTLQKSRENASLQKSSTTKAATLQSRKDVSVENSSTPTETNRAGMFSDDLRKLNPIPNLGRYYHSSTQVGLMGSRGSETDLSSSSSGDISVPLPLATKPSSYSSQAQKTEEMGDSQCLPPLIVSELEPRLSQSHALEQEGAATDLRKHTRTNSESRIALCHPKLLSALLPLLTSRYPGVQINAVAALVNLSVEKENKVGIVRAGAVPYLIDVLKSGHPEAQEHAAGGIFSLALNDENKIAIGFLGAIPPLIHILRAGEERAKQDAAMALYHLSFAPSNKSKLVKMGAVPVLIGLAQDETSRLGSKALMILCNIASIAEGHKALLDANGIAKLVGILAKHQKDRSRGSQEIQEQTVAILLLLSQNNLRFVSLSVQAGAMELLFWLSENGNARAKEKASILLSMMKEVSSSEEECPDSRFSRHQTRRLGQTGSSGPNSTGF